MVDFNEIMDRALRGKDTVEDVRVARESAQTHFNEAFKEIAEELMTFTMAAYTLFKKAHEIDDLDRRNDCSTEAMNIAAKMFAYISVMGIDIVSIQQAGELNTYAKTVQLLVYAYVQELIMVKGMMQKARDGSQT